MQDEIILAIQIWITILLLFATIITIKEKKFYGFLITSMFSSLTIAETFKRIGIILFG